jgi:transcriptional regulator with XRE-family HTH domain
MATFASRLRELRGKAGLTQKQLAEASGLPVGSLRHYEQGQREPYWQVVFRLARGLGVASDAFADCVGDRPARPGRKKGK